jgi:hypothetical protein
MKEFKSDFSEGRVARGIEEQTAKLPSDLFLWAALASIGTSLALKIMGKTEGALFVGQWAPTLLILGTYNKMVKQHGSESATGIFSHVLTDHGFAVEGLVAAGQLRWLDARTLLHR